MGGGYFGGRGTKGVAFKEVATVGVLFVHAHKLTLSLANGL